MTDYTEAFYSAQREESLRSARVVLPLLFSHYRPASVVDVGCGVGTWLKACIELGVDDICGIDGDHVPTGSLLIPRQSFRTANLSGAVAAERKYGLAISLEVAEHLPETRARTFVEDLTQLSAAVLFSAAIPYQGGTAHINENWLEYWATIFRGFGYEPVDFLRRRLWNNNQVCWWYRQNLIVFSDKDFIASNGLSGLRSEPGSPLSLVHPEMFLWAVARQRRVASSRYPRDIELRETQLAAWHEGKAEAPPQAHTYGNEFHDDFGGFSPLRQLRRLANRFRR